MSRIKDHLEKKRLTAQFWEYAEKEFMRREEIKKSDNEAYWKFFNKRFNR